MAKLSDDELMLDGTPEQIEALEAKYGEGGENIEVRGDSREGATTQPAAPATPAAAAPAQAGSGSGADATSGATPNTDVGEQIAGVATKDGKHVLPYTVLRNARRDASMFRQRAEAAEQQTNQLTAQIEALREGRTLPDDALGDDGMVELLKDFPQLAGLVAEVKGLREKAATAKPDPAREIDDQLDAQEELDAALAQRSLLSRFSQTGGALWARAIEIDKAVMSEPEYAGMSAALRLTETERRLAAELGIALPQPRVDPPTALALDTSGLPSVQPNTLSDLGGGRAPTDEMSQLANLSGSALVNRFESMSVDEMDRLLARAA